MTSEMDLTSSTYVTVAEAARLAGVSRTSVSRRIRAGEIAVFVGSDRRQRLLRRADVVGLAQVRPVEPGSASERGARS